MQQVRSRHVPQDVWDGAKPQVSVPPEQAVDSKQELETLRWRVELF